MTEPKPGVDLYTELRKIPAIAALPANELDSLAQTVYRELELRVGTALSAGLSEAQFEEFEALHAYEEAHPELNGNGPALAWLATNRPHYQETVQQTAAQLFADTAALFTPEPH